MTKFLVRNNRRGKFHTVSRKRYKEIARESSEGGSPFRVETMYVRGVPVKLLTLLGESK